MLLNSRWLRPCEINTNASKINAMTKKQKFLSAFYYLIPLDFVDDCAAYGTGGNWVIGRLYQWQKGKKLLLLVL